MDEFIAWNTECTDLLIKLLDLSKTFLAHKKQMEYISLLSTLHGEKLSMPIAEMEESEAKSADETESAATVTKTISLDDIEKKINDLAATIPEPAVRIVTLDKIPALPDTSSLDASMLVRVQEQAKVWFDEWISSVTFSKILFAMEKCTQLLHEMTHHEGWSLTRESGNAKTFYRAEEGLPTHSFKVIDVANVDIMSLFAVIFEADLYKDWFPFMSDTKELASPTRFNKICQAIVGAPWPFYNREFVMDAFGVDNSEEGRVLINIASVPASGHPALPGGELPAVPKGACRCQMHMGGYMLEILTKNTTRVSFFTNLDPEIAVLPTSLLNLVTGKMVHTIVQEMEKAAKNVSNPKFPYIARRQEKSQVYNDVQLIVDQVILALDEKEKNELAKAI